MFFFIKNFVDLIDFGLIVIGRGCSKLVRFEINGCMKVIMRGLGIMVCLFKKIFVDVSILGCKYLDVLVLL